MNIIFNLNIKRLGSKWWSESEFRWCHQSNNRRSRIFEVKKKFNLIVCRRIISCFVHRLICFVFWRENFNVRPTIGWQIDPFGHSSMTATLFAQMGFEAVVLNRIHHALKADFKRAQHMEFVWQPSHVIHRNNTNQNTDIFAHVLHTHYSAPQGFDWENGGVYFVLKILLFF